MTREERLDGLLDYLRTHVHLIEANGMRREGWVLNSAYQAVLRYGRICGPAVPLDREFENTTGRECFANALLESISHRDLTYVEGYAHDGLIPIHHAWLVNRHGDVLDPTWGYRPDGVYVGIAFRTQWACNKIVEQNQYGLLDGINPYRGLPKRALSTRKIGEPVPGPDIDPEAVQEMRKTFSRAREVA